jgi:YfiH family protein
MAAGTQLAPLPAPFAWRGEHIEADLGHGARVLFTTRRGGVSRPPFDSLNLGPWTEDDPGDVAANRERVAARVGIPRERFAQGRQVHGAGVVRVTTVPQEVVEADGAATALPGVAAIVLTADCLPVALATPGAVAMVHAGWKGLACGVLEEGVRAVRELGGDDGPLVAAIGPGAGGCCYEVGDDVREQLGLDALGHPATVDLKRLARERLAAAGAGAVHDAGVCTMCSGVGGDRLLFSHRRDGPRTGRQGGVAWRSS